MEKDNINEESLIPPSSEAFEMDHFAYPTESAETNKLVKQMYHHYLIAYNARGSEILDLIAKRDFLISVGVDIFYKAQDFINSKQIYNYVVDNYENQDPETLQALCISYFYGAEHYNRWQDIFQQDLNIADDLEVRLTRTIETHLGVFKALQRNTNIVEIGMFDWEIPIKVHKLIQEFERQNDCSSIDDFAYTVCGFSEVDPMDRSIINAAILLQDTPYLHIRKK